MESFSKNIKEIVENQTISVEELSKQLGFKYKGMIYGWINGRVPRLKNIVSFADYFNVSLDYLFGRIDIDSEAKKYKKCPPFDQQLKLILKQKNISQNKLIKETNFSAGHLYKWFNKKLTPKMDTIIELADYLGVSLDYLVGREK